MMMNDNKKSPMPTQPIFRFATVAIAALFVIGVSAVAAADDKKAASAPAKAALRSEEHTSELQSP